MTVNAMLMLNPELRGNLSYLEIRMFMAQCYLLSS